MTTPAVDISTKVKYITQQKYYVNDVLQNTTSWVEPSSWTVAQRPESISSPIGEFGLRPPTQWWHYGGRGTGVKGMHSVTYAGPQVTRYVTTGVMGAIAYQPGMIPVIDPQGSITAIRKALGTYGETHAQAGAAMKEAKQTADMVKKYYDHANTLADKTLKAVNGNKRVKQQFKDFVQNGWSDVPGAYLEYLFGMKPLADDVTNAVRVLTDRSQAVNSAMLFRLRGKHEIEESREEHYWRNVVSEAPIYGTVRIKQTNRASMLFQLPSWYWETLPPVTFFSELWETTRLSFVADWVLPVNQWIAGLEGFQLRPFFKWGTVSTKLERSVDSPRSPDTNFIRLDAAGEQSASFERRVFTTWPGEELFSLPRMRNIFGIDKLNVGAALLGQKLASLQRAVRS